jgi:hypothetical protein
MITDFGLSKVSLAMLALLEAPAREHCVSPWYNGRERGICIAVQSGLRVFDMRYVVFHESRNSDHICVSTWVGSEGMNPPTCGDRPETAYHLRRLFDPGEITSAVEHVQGLIDGE